MVGKPPVGSRNRCRPGGYVALNDFTEGSRIAPMDCKHFRKNHLAYLDDTLPGELMAEAQRHLLVCDGCAAHDTLVRRSLMVVRSMRVIEPSAAFQSRLRARLAACREECAAERRAGLTAAGAAAFPGMASSVMARVRPTLRPALPPTRTVMMVAAGAMLGVMAWQAMSEEPVPALAMQPVMETRPAPMSPTPYITPALVQAMSTGNPVWPAAMLMEQAPVGFVNAQYSLSDMR